MVLPAWDCLPSTAYSPNDDVMARRLDALAAWRGRRPPRLVITTVNALLQKLPPPEVLRHGLFAAQVGERIDREQLLACLAATATGAAAQSSSPANTRCAAASSTSFRAAASSRCGSTCSATCSRRSAPSIR